MRLILGIFICYFGLYSCVNRDANKEQKYYPLLDSLPLSAPRYSNISYYPLNSFSFTPDSNEKNSDVFIKNSYSQILFNLREPVLYTYQGEYDFIRMLWIRPFDNPVVIRINKFKERASISIKELQKKYFNDDGFSYEVKIDTNIRLGIDQWQSILTMMTKENFWIAKPNDTVNNYKDITYWTFEGMVGNKYYCINRSYIDTASFNHFAYAKKMVDLANNIILMKNSRAVP